MKNTTQQSTKEQKAKEVLIGFILIVASCLIF